MFLVSCAGTVMNVNYVVTAAHCVVKYADQDSVNNPEYINVRVGSIMSRSGGQLVYTKKALIHISEYYVFSYKVQKHVNVYVLTVITLQYFSQTLGPFLEVAPMDMTLGC